MRAAAKEPGRGGPADARIRQCLKTPVVWLVAALAAAMLLDAPLRQMRRVPLEARGEDDTQRHPAWIQYVMVGLGGFRGVISEVLWMRAGRLQEQGRYFEQVQLADWITTLDPRAIGAWVYNSWNLAYNISAMMPRFEDRQTWVDAGISLLRDRAIPANPGSPQLYRELGWLYQNKLGDATDPAHEHYKLALAATMTPLLAAEGAPPPAGSVAAARLQDEHRLDIRRMHEIDESLGGLDWRLPQSHAIYWAWSGLPVVRSGEFEHQALRRMIHQNLFSLIEQGRFTGTLDPPRFAAAPRLDLLPPTAGFLEETVRLYPGEIDIFASFLASAVRHQTRAGDQEEARSYYRRLRDLAGDRYAVPSIDDLTGDSPPSGDAILVPPSRMAR